MRPLWILCSLQSPNRKPSQHKWKGMLLAHLLHKSLLFLPKAEDTKTRATVHRKKADSVPL